MTDSTFEVRVEIPTLAALAGSDAAPATMSEQTAVHIQRLSYQPDAADVWNLPTEQAAIVGALDTRGAVPQMRCTLPLPKPDEIALYRVTILKTGTVHDDQGHVRNEQLLPTEEELLFFVLGAETGATQGDATAQAMRAPIVPGIQCIVIQTPAR